MAKGRRAGKEMSISARRASPDLAFNHAMIYTAGLQAAREFYQGALGFQPLDEYPGVYVRLKSPSGSTTIALHSLDAGQTMSLTTEGLRLYFEVRGLDAFCKALQKRGLKFDQMPKDMPWGWRHAYLRDPDGHEISLYWAGKRRVTRTVAPKASR